ncbi:Protein kinase domain [Sesbania bispinosa]|nr:Protein kinase domain [Sesbania bispinosa]
MKNFLVSLYFLFPAIIAVILVLFTPIPSAQLTTSENRILLQVQRLLEYPQVLQEWTNFTNFCYLPPSPSLKIVCLNAETLSERFSIDSFFTVLTKLSNMKVLSLVSLGLWGPLPSKISRFWSLVLVDNLFNGSVPNLRRLASLEELNLGGNRFGPEFPSVDKNLVKIILRNNSLRCQIPSQLMHVDKLQLFDISSNAIFGNIPSFLFSLPFLQHLNLAANQLSGSLPVNISCSPALTFVDISHNLLIGKLPSCIGSKSSNRTILYSGNCLSIRSSHDQHPSSYCKKVEALAVNPQLKRQKKEMKMLLRLVLGITGGVVGIAGLLVLLILCILRKSKAERADSNIDRCVDYIDDKVSVRAYPKPNNNARHVPPLMRFATLGLPPYSIFTLEEIEDATNNFDQSSLIGEGSQGQLYKGCLRDGSMVMVNLVKLKDKSLAKNSIQNLKVLPYLRHRHLVSVLGHSVITYQDRPQTTSTIFIVFEHITNVSLRDHLTDRRKKEMLKWTQRMAISTGIARGIQFLHTGVNTGIFGNNIKIENILLDNSLNAKITGYSIPLPSKKVLDRKLNEQSAPNHIGSINNAEKEDIYQLGVILLELITGKLITSSNDVEELKYELERGLSEAASPMLMAASPILIGTIDPSLQGTYTYESLKIAVQITINCLSKVSSNRPSVEDVLWNLQYSMQVQEARTSSGNLNLKF